jgi:hypothetical protein
LIPVMYNSAQDGRSLDRWRLFLALAISLIVAGMFRSAWATRRDGFTIDEPWHITAGVAYLRTGEYYLNPEHPPLVKLVAGLAAPRSVFRFVEPTSLHDKNTERRFVEQTMYEQNDADFVQSRVRRAMYLFNGFLLLGFALSAYRIFGGTVALGALVFALIDPTVAAHWPVVMTDLPVAILSVTSVLLRIHLLPEWKKVDLCLLAIALGLMLSAKHSGLISFGFVATLGFGAPLWQSRHDGRRLARRRAVIFLAVLGGAMAILWGTYGFRYFESKTREEKFNRSLASKIEDVRTPIWRSSLRHLATWRVLPRSYVWGLADIVRTGMEGRAYSTYAFGELTFMKRRPLIFPGYIVVRVPFELTLLSCFGCLLAFRRGMPGADKIATAVLLALAGVLLIVLMRSNADYAGVRHALTVYFVMAVLCGFAVRFLLRMKAVGVVALGLTLGACTPALIVERPWEYHNFLAGGTDRAYRYFRNDGIDLGQRDKEIAEYCRRKLEPAGDVPYVGYYLSLIKPDLVSYRYAKVKALDNPSGEEFPSTTISGTLLVHASGAAPAIWSDHKALREAQPVDRMGNVLVFRGTYYLPNIRADALFDRAMMLFEDPNPNFPRIESLLKEGLSLRSNDYSGWMMLGNLHLIRGEREPALTAYRNARDSTPPSPFRTLFEEQVEKVSSQPLDAVKPMRDPGIE